MVYSSIPINILVEDRSFPVGDDESLSISSAGSQEKDTIFSQVSAESQEKDTIIPEAELSKPSKSPEAHIPKPLESPWELEINLFEQEENVDAAEYEETWHQSIPKSMFDPPMLEDVGYPDEDMEEQLVHGTSASFLNSRPTFRRRSILRIPMHTRIEMLQHQLGKPFRALSSGIKLPDRSKNLDCSGVSMLNNVVAPDSVSDGEESFTSTAVVADRRARVPGKEDLFTQAAMTSFDKYNEEEHAGKTLENSILQRDWRNEDKTASLSPASANFKNDSGFMYSRSAWPLEVNFDLPNRLVADSQNLEVSLPKKSIGKEDETQVTRNSSMDSSSMEDHPRVTSFYDLY